VARALLDVLQRCLVAFTDCVQRHQRQRQQRLFLRQPAHIEARRIGDHRLVAAGLIRTLLLHQDHLERSSIGTATGCMQRWQLNCTVPLNCPIDAGVHRTAKTATAGRSAILPARPLLETRQLLHGKLTLDSAARPRTDVCVH
jgi:hypothetical protein